jgi:hypothetical protein
MIPKQFDLHIPKLSQPVPLDKQNISGTICPRGPNWLGTKLVGDHLSMGTKFMGTICPWGQNWLGSRGTNQLGTNGGWPNVWGPYVFGTECVTAGDPRLHNDILWGLKALCAKELVHKICMISKFTCLCIRLEWCRKIKKPWGASSKRWTESATLGWNRVNWSSKVLGGWQWPPWLPPPPDIPGLLSILLISSHFCLTLLIYENSIKFSDPLQLFGPT